MNKRDNIIVACAKQIGAIPFVTSNGVDFHMANA